MTIMTKEKYIESLKELDLKVYLFGEPVENITDNPIIRPSMNSVALTYDMAQKEEYKDLMLATSSLTGEVINRFAHLYQNNEDLIKRVKIQRLLGQNCVSCFQRCVGLDAGNALFCTTYEIDEKYGTDYHKNFLKFWEHVRKNDLTVDGAMTDAKGDRSLRPSEQPDPDMFLRVVERRKDGIVVRGAKEHQTGIINSHEVIVMPTQSMCEEDKDYAVSFAIPTDTDGIIIIYGRQSCDTRKLEEGVTIDLGNYNFGGHEALVIFEDVFVPDEGIFINGEVDFSGSLVERFAGYHRQSYDGCKVGV